MSRKTEFFFLLLMLFATVPIAGYLTVFWHEKNSNQVDYRHPIDMNKPIRAEALNSPVEVGGKLRIRIWRVKVRNDCETTADRTAVNHNGQLLDVPNARRIDGRTEDPFVVAEYDTSLFPPDNYIARASLLFSCPNGVTHHLIQPEIPFQIVDSDAPQVESVIIEQQQMIDTLSDEVKGLRLELESK